MRLGLLYAGDLDRRLGEYDMCQEEDTSPLYGEV